MPRLLRGVARTAVVAGTAAGVAGRVQRRQDERFAERDAEVAARREQAYAQQIAPPPPAPPPPPPSGGADAEARIHQLKELGDLKQQGLLTEEEFAAEKAKLLRG